MRRLKTALLSVSLSILGMGFLAMALATTLGSTAPLPATVLGWDVSLSNVTFERTEPSDLLLAKFDISVRPLEQSDSYKLEQLKVQAELWKFRTRGTPEGVTLTDRVKLLDSDDYFFSVVGTPTFSASGAIMPVTKHICGYIGRELDPDSTWGWGNPKGPADGFVVIFHFNVQGTKASIPILGSAAFTVPLDHQQLCGS